MKKIAEGEVFEMGGKFFSYRINESGGVVLSMAEKSVAKTAKNTFKSPSLDEVKAYFKEKGYMDSAAIKFYEYYSSADWKDGKGNQVKNWKQKAVGVWFRDDYKISDKPGGMVR